MALALLGCLTVVAQLDAVRQKLITPATDLTVAQPGLIRSGQDWILERGLIDPSGTRLPEPDCGIGVSPQACASRHGATGWYLDYHPASHLWPLQWAEAGITVGGRRARRRGRPVADAAGAPLSCGDFPGPGRPGPRGGPTPRGRVPISCAPCARYP
ncbi:hypothetical protein GCM10020000_34720 [Streptomyces olivoverticillatus]